MRCELAGLGTGPRGACVCVAMCVLACVSVPLRSSPLFTVEARCVLLRKFKDIEGKGHFSVNLSTGPLCVWF